MTGQTYSSEDVPRIIRALKSYYSRLDTARGISLGGACHVQKVNPVLAIDYIIDNSQGPLPLGEPSDREEALSYLKNLKKLEQRFSTPEAT